jgi:hypothetical protein
MRNLLLVSCFSLCFVTVRVIMCSSFCNLQFLESLLWVPGRRREHYEWNTREANQVCGCVLACTYRSSLCCVCVYLYTALFTLQCVKIKVVTIYKASCLWCCSSRCYHKLYMLWRGAQFLYMHVGCVYCCLQPVGMYCVAYETRA